MVHKPVAPRIALNKSYLKVKPNRNDIEKFKAHVIELLDQINEKETEEFHKNIISKFLDKTYYGGNHYINTKGRNDLVIHTEKDAKSSVGVIIETKKPTNKGEMVQKGNLNTKAFQELVLYYMRERISGNNLEVKNLIITNIYEWFIFDVDIFEKAFAQNKDFEKKFVDFEEKRLAGKNTDFFYKEIAEPAVDELLSGKSKLGKELEYTYFDIREYEKIVRNADKQDDKKLIALFKLLSPEHLLKLPFRNDSNSLDKTFYAELLHIIGLTEVKDGGKKLIERKPEGKRDEGSIIENTISQLNALDKISRLEKPTNYGANSDERYFNVALELAITWVNRTLFLKLLEAQLLSYHKNEKAYSFLNNNVIKSFDDLNSLFFQVLAKKPVEREQTIKNSFSKIPYLNSSLFEPTDLEHSCLFISQLQDKKGISIISNTVLKDTKGKKRTGTLNALEYLFSFLDAYDFSSEGAEEIQEDNKTLISASVLGLIFEKINGYKDGSYFTPGFITMHMSRESIRRAVIQKFNDAKKWNCSTIYELYDKIDDKKEANSIINDLKICDPAVGSGHFLVSALNEIISLKAELGILLDLDGKRLRDYVFEVSNDELVISHEDGKLFDYIPGNKESQRLQEALFHEKQTIIENCLFGVDINPNSVKICRLRLWIELLKQAYYKREGNYLELETLPNIDINIKCGNSLISRFALGLDLAPALKKSKITIKSYKQAVQSYRHASTKDEKRDMELLIAKIKSDFRTEISNNDPLVKKLSSARGDLEKLLNQHSLFELSKAEKKIQKEKEEELNETINELEGKIEEIKSNRLYENAFEWRFEFPEVLDDKGLFIGFDLVIANPPYGVEFKDNERAYFKLSYPISSDGKIDSYKLFYELSFRILKQNYYQAFIAPNTFLYNVQSKKLRTFLLDKSTIQNAVELRKNIFEDAPDVVTVIMLLKYSHKGQYDFPMKVAYADYKYSNIDLDEWMINQVIPIKTFRDDDEKKINLRRDFKLDGIINKMNSHPRLGASFDLKQGTKPYGEKENKSVELLSKTKKSKNWEPAINGRNISQFHISFEDDYVLRSDDLHSCLDETIVNNPKIYFQRMRKISLFPRIVAAYDESKIHGLYTCSVIYPKEETTIELKYVLAVINSHLANVWYKNYDTDIEIKLTSVKNIPLPIASKKQTDQIVKIVEQIMANKIHDGDNTLLISELNNLIYKLFDLTSEEIKIVESA
ncbi:MAG: TaqI-like C-terminal specificity domain-containing protein [Chitinophagaceae bacterium]